MTSAPASTRALQRSLSLGRVPMAAPTSSCLLASFEASGNSFDFLISIGNVNTFFKIKKRSY